MEEKLDRRQFLSVAGATGIGYAGALMNGARSPIAPTRTFEWPSDFNPKSNAPIWFPRDLPKPGDLIHEYDVELVITTHEIVPGVECHMFGYNGLVPGPEFRVRLGDWIKVNFTNKTYEYHTIHWHGMMLANEMDGVPLGTQWPVGYGQTYQYLFRAQPAGTHYYHCHNMTPLHIQAGMYGPLIVETDDDPVFQQFNYTRDYTMVLSEIDTNYVRDEMNEMLQMFEEMDYLSKSGKMSEMSPRMMGWFVNYDDFLKAIKEGYVPPYAPSMTGPPRIPHFNFFMINGKSYPATESLMIREGENIRVRLIGAGANIHMMHLHGHDYWHVCQDGSPLASPIRCNTIPIYPGTTSDIVISGTNPGHWHFHDHSDFGTTNNGIFPGGMMTMLMYEDATKYGVAFKDVIAVSS